MKYSGLALSCLFALSGFSSASMAAEKNAAEATPAPMHGSAENPVSRQYYCKLQNDFDNPPDGSGIKNGACKQAYQNGDFENWQRPAAFNEWSAYSQNISSSTTPDKPIDLVPDGMLCSAGKTGVYEGINLPSAEWQTSELDVKDGRVQLVYKATQMHDPSKFRVFFSNASFDPTTSRLKWGDLVESPEVKHEGTPDVANSTKHENTPGHYALDVKLPDGYIVSCKKSIVYIMWERNDPARETFFSCSDVVLKDAS
ncbi:lytic polysaccharide monooxygenase [Jejubacter calystegiae]|uniref:Lytic polysaccharide monooxygenase n=1 Tax=Jejubacter calystegiae TaxID=2579935 RepID=A0A4V1G7X7_9ENTR|nr:lytic polysaccharide monooxygenase auxiliary activity family 9 protein [Jejubacter calystegiae]QCT21187.1 lytic polysaccharide monooxygenase [Jejubacter calystegiae]